MAEEQNPPRIIVGSAHMKLPRFTGSGTLTTRQGFVALHLCSAAHFSRQVGAIERQHEGQPLGGFFEEITLVAPPCILCAAAALEAHINEVFADRKQNFPNADATEVEKRWNNLKRSGVLTKCDLALTFLGLPKLDRQPPYVSHTEALLELRHALTHFNPEWSNETAEHAALSTRLDGMFTGSPFMSATERLFPMRWRTHAGTKWAVETAKAFITAFEAQMGMTGKRSKIEGWNDGRLDP